MAPALRRRNFSRASTAAPADRNRGSVSTGHARKVRRNLRGTVIVAAMANITASSSVNFAISSVAAQRPARKCNPVVRKVRKARKARATHAALVVRIPVRPCRPDRCITTSAKAPSARMRVAPVPNRRDASTVVATSANPARMAVLPVRHPHSSNDPHLPPLRCFPQRRPGAGTTQT